MYTADLYINGEPAWQVKCGSEVFLESFAPDAFDGKPLGWTPHENPKCVFVVDKAEWFQPSTPEEMAHRRVLKAHIVGE